MIQLPLCLVKHKLGRGMQTAGSLVDDGNCAHCSSQHLSDATCGCNAHWALRMIFKPTTFTMRRWCECHRIFIPVGLEQIVAHRDAAKIFAVDIKTAGQASSSEKRLSLTRLVLMRSVRKWKHMIKVFHVRKKWATKHPEKSNIFVSISKFWNALVKEKRKSVKLTERNKLYYR